MREHGMDKATNNQSPASEFLPFHAQFGEDRLLADRFFRGRESGICVEVGAGDGVRFSNSAYFERLGWRCLLIEANPEAASACQRNRTGTVVHAAVVAKSTGEPVSFAIAEDCGDLSSLEMNEHNLTALKRYFGRVALRYVDVPASTLDALLESWQPDGPIDFVTIDVEGKEYEVLQGFDLERWAPRIVIVERNERRPQWRVLRYFRRAGYRFGMKSGVNDWYMRPSDIPRRGFQHTMWLIRSIVLGR